MFVEIFFCLLFFKWIKGRYILQIKRTIKLFAIKIEAFLLKLFVNVKMSELQREREWGLSQQPLSLFFMPDFPFFQSHSWGNSWAGSFFPCPCSVSWKEHESIFTEPHQPCSLSLAAGKCHPAPLHNSSWPLPGEPCLAGVAGKMLKCTIFISIYSWPNLSPPRAAAGEWCGAKHSLGLGIVCR